MDCNQYRKWLEDRDLSDISEADRATSHAHECRDCTEMTKKDEVLDRKIGSYMQQEPLPEHLEKIVTMNLTSSVSSRRRLPTGLIKLASLTAGVAALLLVFFLIPADFTGFNDFGAALARDHNEIMRRHPVDSVQDLDRWIAANADFPASLPEELNLDGLSLFGAKICPIGNCRTVHLVYSTGEGFVSLFIIAAEQMETELEPGKSLAFHQKGNSIKMWREGDQVFALIS